MSPSKKGIKRMSIYLAPTFEDRLKDEARQKGLSINGLINVILENYFKEQLKKKVVKDEKKE
jgi:predicted HicB family RNase H-like nuclease